MDALFQWCAIIGATIFFGQFALSLLTTFESGLHVPHGEVDAVAHDFDSPAHNDLWFVGMFSIRAISAGTIVFGLAVSSLEPAPRMLVALAGGFGTMYLMGWLIRSMHRLESDGTVHLQDTIGASGTVYLPIPNAQSGTGKVTVVVKERTMEYPAMTSAESLPPGTPVVVTGIISDGVIEVSPVTEQAVS